MTGSVLPNLKFHSISEYFIETIRQFLIQKSTLEVTYINLIFFKRQIKSIDQAKNLLLYLS